MFVEPELDGARPITPPTPRAQIVAARLAGKHAAVGRREVEHVVDRLASGAPDAGLGLDFGPVAREEARDALVDIWGWDPGSPRATIDPDRTLAGLERACRRIASVAALGGRIALATGRPASFLPLYRAVAAHARALGGLVLTADEQRIDGRGGRVLWWLDGVAVVTDGSAVLAEDAVDAGGEWLFALGIPDLVVADLGFAAAAAAAGHETVALAGFDGVALGVAARRGRPVSVVPIQDGQPPTAYRVAIDCLTQPGLDSHAAPAPGHPHPAPDAQGSQSTT